MYTWIPLLAACVQHPDTALPPTPEETGDSWAWFYDTGNGQDDADADGWTVEQGDCDDTDPQVNPARQEDPGDGKDDDCDGRIDERFSGLAVLVLADPPRIATVDSLGRTVQDLAIDDSGVQERLSDYGFLPYFLAPDPRGTGWVVGDFTSGILVSVAADGSTELLAEVSELGDDHAVWGIATHPDGYVYVATGPGVARVDPETGLLEQVASFDPDTQLYAFDLAVDLVTGDIGIFGIYGAFALLHPDGSTEILRTEDPQDYEYVFWSGNHRDGGGWYAGGWDASGYGMFRFRQQDASWVLRAGWEEDWSPHFMTIDGDSGDFYVTTEGGQYPYVWRLLEDGSQAAVFWPEQGTHSADEELWDLYALY